MTRTTRTTTGTGTRARGRTTTTRFDRDTALVAAGDGVFRGRIDPGWWIERGPNGGYVAAIILRGLTMAVGDDGRTPRSLTIHYLAPPVEGPVEMVTTIERSGRSLTYVSGRLVQEGRLVGLAVGAFAVPLSSSIEFQHVSMPADVRGPDDLSPPPPPFGGRVIPLRERYETRQTIGGLPFSGAEEAASGGWIRLAEARPVDHLLMAALTDAWMPPIFTKVTMEKPIGVPTIDLTIHFRAPLPVEGLADDAWMFALFRTRVAAEGFIEEDGEIWAPDGRLLAQSRQLALLMA
ncbi:MAG: acyl-CoA thioesterase [Actinomycetota bacterium]